MLSLDDDPELQEALKNWFPANRKPVLLTDWEKLLNQAGAFAWQATEGYEKAKASGIPHWFLQRLARSKYRLSRRYVRLRRRVEKEQYETYKRLLHAIGHTL